MKIGFVNNEKYILEIRYSGSMSFVDKHYVYKIGTVTKWNLSLENKSVKSLNTFYLIN